MGETVEFPSNGHTASGYLAKPPSGHGPGVVVIQEWWGVNEHIRDLCDRFAGEGFVALAPDLYHGKETREPDEAGKLLMELDLAGAARDMLGAGKWLAASEHTAGDRVGIVGFCMGGALAIYAATLSDVFAAVVPFYPYMGVTAAAKPDQGGGSRPFCREGRGVHPRAGRSARGRAPRRRCRCGVLLVRGCGPCVLQ